MVPPLVVGRYVETDHGATIGGGEVCCVCVWVCRCV